MNNTDNGSIRVDFPQASDLRLHIVFGACRLDVRPGEGEAWASARVVEPRGLALAVSRDGGRVRISRSQDFDELIGVLSGGLPACQVLLGGLQPYALSLEIGAGEYRLDLGGLPLTKLDVRQGAGKVRVDFSRPNPVQMTSMRVAGGAGELDMRNLGNAGCAQIHLEGGMAACKLDFGGELRRDTEARVAAAFSTVEISIPGSTACRVRPEGAIMRTDAGPEFRKVDGTFWNAAAEGGLHPLLLIRTSAVAGTLRLRAF